MVVFVLSGRLSVNYKGLIESISSIELAFSSNFVDVKLPLGLPQPG